MAKNWTYIEEEGILLRNYKDDVESLEIDMDRLFPGWLEFEKVQKQVVINGMKQKLDDAIARSKDQALTEKEKAEVQYTLAERILHEREYNMPSQAGTRGPSVSLAIVVPAFAKKGMSAEAIAETLGKPLEVIQKYISESEEE